MKISDEVAKSAAVIFIWAVIGFIIHSLLVTGHSGASVAFIVFLGITVTATVMD